MSKGAVRSSVIICAPADFEAATVYLKTAVADNCFGACDTSVGIEVTSQPVKFAIACAVAEALLTGAHRLDLDAKLPISGDAAEDVARLVPTTVDPDTKPKVPAVMDAVVEGDDEQGGGVIARAMRRVTRFWRGRMSSKKPVKKMTSSW
jgi:hypothetical protein